MADQSLVKIENWVLTGQILELPDTLSTPLLTRSEKFQFFTIARFKTVKV